MRECWSARELQELLGCSKWQQFEDVVERAQVACRNAGHDPEDHFAGAGKMVGVGSGAARRVEDYHLSRYACYMVAMDGDPRKPGAAAAPGVAGGRAGGYASRRPPGRDNPRPVGRGE